MNIIEKAFRDGVETLNQYQPPGTKWSEKELQEIADDRWEEWQEENKAEFQSAQMPCSTGEPVEVEGGLKDGAGCYIEYYKLAIGTRFKYSQSADYIWTKLPNNLIVEYAKTLMIAGGWHGQKICSFDDKNDHNKKVWVESLSA